MLHAAGNAIVRVLLAPDCPVCHRPLQRPLESPICGTCWTAIPRLAPPFCDWCGDVLPAAHRPFVLCERCLRAPPGFEVARSAGVYAGPLRELIHAFKYDRRRMLAAPLASLIAGCGQPILDEADAVIPVPLHPLRSMSRGFNQADDLAQHLGRPVWRVLRRVRLGPPQATLPAHRRSDNVSAAFARRLSLALVPGRSASARLKHSTVVLIDDVMTTGATMEACSRVLVEAGVKSVRVLTVARAAVQGREPPPPPPRPSDPRLQ